MGLFYNHDPIFFYHKTSQSSTGNAFDGAVTPSAGETLILVIKSQKTTASCPVCSQSSHHLHQNYRYLVRDLPIGNKEVMLRVNRRRFKCKNCRKPFNESLAFLEKKKNFTKRYAQSIAEQVVHSDINNVAKNNKLTEEEVWSMVKAVANKI
jgi:transposase